MTAPQRQHRWLAADHLEQKSSVTLRSQGDTTERRGQKLGEELEKKYEGGEVVDGVKSRMKKQSNYGTE